MESTEKIEADMTIEMVHRQENGELKDSLEFGPANLRAKVYVNIADPEDARARCEEMKMLMMHMKASLEEDGIDGGRRDKPPAGKMP